MEQNQDNLRSVTRRHFFGQATSFGVGSLALASLLNDKLFAQSAASVNLKPKAKSVIFLFMAGAPSQLDLFDYKPELNRLDGKPCPEELIKGERFAFIKGVPKLLGSPHTFRKHGQSGAELSGLLPHLATVVDDIAVIKSMYTTQFNHAPAQIFMNTGHQVPGRPSMGSWLSYGLGAENKDLPAFIVLLSGQNAPDGGKSCYGSGFLPSTYGGVEFRRSGDPVLFLSNPDGVTAEQRRSSLDLVNTLNGRHRTDAGDPEIDSRIAAYEMAFRMQTSVPEVADIASEPEHIRAMYGATPGRLIREQLSASPPPGGARRSLCAVVPPWLGYARQRGNRRHREQAKRLVPANRPGCRRSREGSQATWAARLHNRCLGR